MFVIFRRAIVPFFLRTRLLVRGQRLRWIRIWAELRKLREERGLRKPSGERHREGVILRWWHRLLIAFFVMMRCHMFVWRRGGRRRRRRR
jgi:hypothetical protein